MIIPWANQRAVTGGMGEGLAHHQVGGGGQAFDPAQAQGALSSASTNPTAASWRRCSDTVD
jgi:hypothetical protein